MLGLILLTIWKLTLNTLHKSHSLFFCRFCGFLDIHFGGLNYLRGFFFYTFSNAFCSFLSDFGRMLFYSEVRHLVFDGPVAFQITRELQQFTIFILLLAFLGIAMRTFLFQLIHC